MARRRRSRRRSGININPAHRGAFTRKGISVSQGLKSSNPRTRAQANFARMAKRGFKPLGSSSGGGRKRRRRRASASYSQPTRRRSTATRARGSTHRVRGHTRITATGRRVRVRAHRRRHPKRR